TRAGGRVDRRRAAHSRVHCVSAHDAQAETVTANSLSTDFTDFAVLVLGGTALVSERAVPPGVLSATSAKSVEKRLLLLHPKANPERRAQRSSRRFHARPRASPHVQTAPETSRSP